MSGEQSSSVVKPIRVMLYSDDRTVRDQVRLALGRKVAADLPEIEIIETATHRAFFKAADARLFDLAILDGEAVPAGGMGIAHQMKEELPDAPPVVLLVARVADAWMGTWSRAEALHPYPIDPIRLPNVVAQVIREHVLTKAVVKA